MGIGRGFRGWQRSQQPEGPRRRPDEPGPDERVEPEGAPPPEEPIFAEDMIRRAQMGPERPLADPAMTREVLGRAETPIELQRPRGDYRNINLDRLDTDAGREQVLDAVSFSTENAGYSRQRWEQVAEEAAAIDDATALRAMMTRKPGEHVSNAVLTKGRSLMLASAARLRDMGRDITERGAHNVSDAELLEYQRALWEHDAIQAAVQGASRDLARGLNLLKRQPDLMDPKAFDELMAMGGGREQILRKAQLIGKADRLEDASKLAGQASWLKKSVDGLIYYRTMNLLSGPRTQVRNIVGNQLAATFSIAERGVAAVYSQTVGSGEITYREAYEYAYGQIGAILDGLRLAKKTLMTGESIYRRTKLDDIGEGRVTNSAEMGLNPESATSKAYDYLAAFVGYPARGIITMDEFYKTLAFNSQVRALAYRQARAEGLSGDAALRRMREMLSGPNDERIMAQLREQGLEGDELTLAFMGERRRGDEEFRRLYEDGMDFAQYQTFQDDLIAAWTKYGHELHKNSPAFRLVVPFYRTIVNLQSYGIERSAFAPLAPKWRQDFMAGGAKRDEAVARATIGLALTYYLIGEALEGELVGSMPQNPQLRSLYRQAGLEPYTWKGVGLQGFEPYSVPLSIVADVADVVRYSDDEKDIEDMMMILAVAFAESMRNRSFLVGISDLMDALEHAKSGSDFASSYTGRMAATFLPAAQLQISIKNVQDGELRDIYDENMWKEIGNTIRNAIPIPYLYEDLPPVLDFWGEPRSPRDWYGSNAGLGWLSPFYGVRYKKDEATYQLAENAAVPNRIPRSINVEVPGGTVPVDLKKLNVERGGKKMSPGWLYYELAKKTGELNRKYVLELMASREYQQTPVGRPRSGIHSDPDQATYTRGDMLTLVMNDAARDARDWFVNRFEAELVQAALEEAERGKRGWEIPGPLRRQRERHLGINF